LIRKLQIASGLEICDVPEKFEYLLKSGYREYDLAPVEQDCELRAQEASLCVWLNSRISGNDLAKIWESRRQIELALQDVPNDVDLLGLADSRFADLANAVLRLVILTSCHRVRLSKVTKILHKKRPLLIPILDNVITDYYDDGLLAGHRFAENQRSLEHLRSFRNDLESVGKEVRSIKVSLSNMGTELTHCRIAEFLIWKQLMDNRESAKRANSAVTMSQI
jgi:Family of unknown function (DUF6308)